MPSNPKFRKAMKVLRNAVVVNFIRQNELVNKLDDLLGEAPATGEGRDAYDGLRFLETGQLQTIQAILAQLYEEEHESDELMSIQGIVDGVLQERVGEMPLGVNSIKE